MERYEIVKNIMNEKNLKMIPASIYVKLNNLYTPKTPKAPKTPKMN